jgi:hypothetical protein
MEMSPLLGEGDRDLRTAAFRLQDFSENGASTAGRRRGAQGREAPGRTLARRDDDWQSLWPSGSSFRV